MQSFPLKKKPLKNSLKKGKEKPNKDGKIKEKVMIPTLYRENSSLNFD